MLHHAQKAPMVDTMKCRIMSVVAAAMIAGLAVYEPSAETRQSADPIDFAHLNQQAAAALQHLQTAQQQRLSPAFAD